MIALIFIVYSNNKISYWKNKWTYKSAYMKFDDYDCCLASIKLYLLLFSILTGFSGLQQWQNIDKDDKLLFNVLSPKIDHFILFYFI